MQHAMRMSQSRNGRLAKAANSTAASGGRARAMRATITCGELGSAGMSFWSDDFDMDLPKVIPGARDLLGDLGDMELWTGGRPDSRFGNLNHPEVWNGDTTMLAYFGFRGTSRPSHCVGSGAVVKCTVWEAFRDAWPHSYLILVEQRPVWDAFALRGEFDTIMFDLRGWQPDADRARHASAHVRRTIIHAVRRFGAIVDDRPKQEGI